MFNKAKFIEKAKQVHGDKYDYSKVNYIDSHTKVCIICPIHGEFWQIPNSHLKGKGCSKCGIINATLKRRSKTEEFINKAREVHGNKYDYSKVEYLNNHTKVCIICPIHGEFWQTPYSHLKHGCPKCSNNKRLTTEEFIEKSRKVHGDKYDYSKVKYINNSTKVCIICPIHGEFWQKPQNHMQGKGCLKCCGKSLTNEEKIAKLKIIHNNKYDYSISDFTNGKEKTKIICPIHGIFEMDYDHHGNSKNGCPKCANNVKLTVDEFEKRCKIKHNNEYVYHQDYVNMHQKIKITCPIHGDFYQEAQAHLIGQGCPKCATKKIVLENEIRKCLNDNDIIFEEQQHFDWLIYKSKLSLDFFIPSKKYCNRMPRKTTFWYWWLD